MTEEKFTELLNLYLDKEISAEDLKLLEAEIAENQNRRLAFVERCRLHKAMRMALKPERSRRSRSRSRSGSRHSKSRRRSNFVSGSQALSSGRRRSGARRSTKISEFDDSLPTVVSGSSIPRWLLFSGMAASMALGVMLLKPVFQNTTDPAAQGELVGVTERELVEQDPLASFGRAELRRFAAVRQQRDSNYHASLVSQMRLMGLRPELTPQDKQFEKISLAAVYQPKERVSQAELFKKVQALKAIPESEWIRIEDADTGNFSSRFGDFEPSLVSFEEL